MRKRSAADSDVGVFFPKSGEAEDSARHDAAFPSVAPSETLFERRLRTRLFDHTWRKVDSLIRGELSQNMEQVTVMVDWLFDARDQQIGERLPGAVMESHMGATVDRSVYHPQLQAALQKRCEGSVVVAVERGDTMHEVIARIGNQLWLQLRDVRARAAALSASQHRTNRQQVLSSHAPVGVGRFEAAFGVADELRKALAQAGPIFVVLLVQDVARGHAPSLCALFKALAEAQLRDARCRSSLSFGVVLWLSTASDLSAPLFDSLFLTQFPFIPLSTMLKNVLFAVLVQPLLPFTLPASVYAWILQQFKEQTFSLSWLAHVLREIIFTHYFRKRGSWIVALNWSWAVDDGFNDVATLRELLPKRGQDVFAKVPDHKLVEACKKWVAGWQDMRKTRFDGFIEFWRLLRRVLPDMQPILESYCEYLGACERKGGIEEYAERIKTAMRSRLVERHDAGEVHQALQLELTDMLDELRHQSAAYARLQEAQRELLCETTNTKSSRAPSPPPQQAAATAEEPLDARNPKSKLLSGGPKSINQRLSSVAGSARNDKSLVHALPKATTQEKLIRQIMTCVFRIFDESLRKPVEIRIDGVREALAYPFADLCSFQGDLAELKLALVGDPSGSVADQLRYPSLGCKCCAAATSAGFAAPKKKTKPASSSSSSAVGNSAAGHKWTDIWKGPLSELRSLEDVCIAHVYYRQTGRAQLDIDDWNAFFCSVLVEEGGAGDAAGGSLKQRFQKVLQQFLILGLIERKGNVISKSAL